MQSQILKNQLNKDELHHAYLIEGAGVEILNELYNFLESEVGFSTRGNPDFWYGEFDTFGIDNGRIIKEMQSRRPVEGERKIFIISANFFTTEAQNSLLKVFEEPTEGTHFFIITQNTGTLLPTLKSRMFELSQQTVNKNKELSFIDTFLKSGKSERLAILKDIIDDKNKNSAISFLNNLEIAIHQSSNSISKFEKSAFLFEEIIKCKKYLNGRSASVKIILEHIALVVPRIE